MVYCAAFGCNNEAQKGNGISFFTFPKDIHLKKAWTHYCRRWDFVPKSGHRLCSVHFSNNCYAMDPDTFANLGMAASFKRRLKPGAIPDVPLLPDNDIKDGERLTIPSRRGAFEKRRKAEVTSFTYLFIILYMS